MRHPAIKTFFLFIVSGVFMAAQPFGAGLKFGVPVTDAFSVQSPNPLAYVESTGRYIVGPYGEVRLPGNFSVEVDALYRSFSFTSAVDSASAGSWEFPVLAKYKFLKGPITPYVEGGLIISHLTGVKQVVELNHVENYGITLGAGLQVKALMLRISPEIRYEGFAFRNFDSPGGILQSNRNQLLVMVGVGF
jgi:hypothetical protein